MPSLNLGHVGLGSWVPTLRLRDTSTKKCGVSYKDISNIYMIYIYIYMCTLHLSATSFIITISSLFITPIPIAPDWQLTLEVAHLTATNALCYKCCPAKARVIFVLLSLRKQRKIRLLSPIRVPSSNSTQISSVRSSCLMPASHLLGCKGPLSGGIGTGKI